ncbi:unnamed protein product [Echinostoma caproni]|uniref:Cwf21 domain-containing protein n=1 Tax=Echinostoma caproni TaxID=27848 RepID=A0A183AG19_9TREM|nr:unnamed protein product [Echinostoma caproni]
MIGSAAEGPSGIAGRVLQARKASHQVKVQSRRDGFSPTVKNEKTQEQINMEFEAELKRLRERERRTLLRCAAKGIGGPTDERESVTSESEDYVSRGSRSPGDIGAQLGRLRVNKGEHSCSSDLEEDSSSDDDPGDS